MSIRAHFFLNALMNRLNGLFEPIYDTCSFRGKNLIKLQYLHNLPDFHHLLFSLNSLKFHILAS